MEPLPVDRESLKQKLLDPEAGTCWYLDLETGDLHGVPSLAASEGGFRLFRRRAAAGAERPEPQERYARLPDLSEPLFEWMSEFADGSLSDALFERYQKALALERPYPAFIALVDHEKRREAWEAEIAVRLDEEIGTWLDLLDIDVELVEGGGEEKAVEPEA